MSLAGEHYKAISELSAWTLYKIQRQCMMVEMDHFLGNISDRFSEGK